MLSSLFQDTYIQERADAMENIHSTIVELGQIFRQLAHMVKEQEEQVVRYVIPKGGAEVKESSFVLPSLFHFLS